MSINGQWEGELNGKVGHFPFTHVEFIDRYGNGKPIENNNISMTVISLYFSSESGIEDVSS